MSLSEIRFVVSGDLWSAEPRGRRDVDAATPTLASWQTTTPGLNRLYREALYELFELCVGKLKARAVESYHFE